MTPNYKSNIYNNSIQKNNSYFRDNMYLSKTVNIKTIFLAILAFIDLVICFSSILILPLTLIDYSAAALGYFLFLSIGFGILSYMRVKSLIYIVSAKSFSRYFMTVNKPFLTIKDIPEPTFRSGAGVVWLNKYKMKNLSLLDGALRKGYLKNCTIEIHAGVPKIALSKKIVKDSCPTCGAPFDTDIKNDVYVCKFCGNEISRVVAKK